MGSRGYSKETRNRKMKNLAKEYEPQGFTVGLGVNSSYILRTDEIKRCPNCGAIPEIQPYIEDKNDPPKRFVGICPRCGLRAVGERSPQEIVRVWNEKKFTSDSRMLIKKMTDISYHGARDLSRATIRLAGEDLYKGVRTLWTLSEEIMMIEKGKSEYFDKIDAYDLVNGTVYECERFLVHIGRHDILDTVRKALYPWMSYEDRQLLPESFTKYPEPDEMRTALRCKKKDGKKGWYSMAEIKGRTKRYYTEYVNHMIRFFLTTEQTLVLDDRKRPADLQNWLAVQSVWTTLSDTDKSAVKAIFGVRDNPDLVGLVKQWANDNGESIDDAWTMLTRISKKIAIARGLI